MLADQLQEAANYDALFVPAHLFSRFRHLADSQRILPVISTFDSDILLSIIEREAIETIGLVTAEEPSIPKLINDLKAATRFEGSLAAGATSVYSLTLSVSSTDLL